MFLHLATAVMERVQQRQMRFGAAATFQRLPCQARGAFALGQRVMWEVIVKHDIGHRKFSDESFEC